MKSTTTEYEGWVVTVYAVAFGMYRYVATRGELGFKSGLVEATDEMDALDEVKKDLTWTVDEILKREG